MTAQNKINHIALVLDASPSMSRLIKEAIRVADSQITYLAQRSKELDQETRVTVYIFSENVECVIYEKDVLRLPSVAAHYQINGSWTALIDATLKSQEDLERTATLYGDHAFLTFVLTDGMDNKSKRRPAELTKLLTLQPDNWTVAVLVPDQRGKHEAKQFGFPADNIAIWDATSVAGMTEAGETIRTATDNFMVGRQSGIRGSRNIFSMGADVLNSRAVRQAQLQEIPPLQYQTFEVREVQQIRPFVEAQGVRYRLGKVFYQLSKPEKVQGHKGIIVRHKISGKAYGGPQARQMLGLPDTEIKVTPASNDEYDLFIQSTSVNRNLMPNTDVIVMA